MTALLPSSPGNERLTRRDEQDQRHRQGDRRRDTTNPGDQDKSQSYQAWQQEDSQLVERPDASLLENHGESESGD
jgi:hypothetical protein